MTPLPLTVWRAWALSLALLLAQALGLHHGVAHAAPGSQRLAATEALGVFQQDSPGAQHQATFQHGAHQQGLNQAVHAPAPAGASLTDHAAGDEQCRLVDQLGHAEQSWLAWPATWVPPPDGVAADAVVQAIAPDATRAPYQARGPP